MSIDKSDMAFPQLSIQTGQRDGHGDLIDPITSSQGGMTLRQWYAGQALQGLISHYGISCAAQPMQEADHSQKAFQIADAMIAEGGA